VQASRLHYENQETRMAELTIRLRRDPETGKQDIHVSLRSDADALPHEHEQMHRQIVEKLIGKGIISSPDDVGNLVVERETKETTPESPVQNPPEQERRAQGQGE
jgi:hypothetical protein